MVSRRHFIIGSSLAPMALTGCATPSANHPGNSRPAQQLSKAYPGHILGPGPAGRCDDKKIGVGVPRWDAASNRFLMWYFCRDREFSSDAPATLGTGRIALAESTNGIQWTRVDGAAAKGAVLDKSPNESDFDSLHLGLTDMMFHEDQWWMCTFGGNREPITIEGRVRLGLRMRSGFATSSDGMNWTKREGPATGKSLIDIKVGSVFSSWPNCVVDDQGNFVLYTTSTIGRVGPFKTWISVSDDQGSTWQAKGQLKWLDEQQPWEAAGIMTRHVQANPFPGKRWLMLYTAIGPAPRVERSIAAAVSDDLIHWQHLYDEPILKKSDGEGWDSLGVAAPQLLVVNGTVMLYYFGLKPYKLEGVPTGVGLAISETGDLLNFKRHV